MQQREGLKKKQNKNKDSSFFSVLNDIKFTKNGTLLNDPESDYYIKFNNYMASRFLSMDPKLAILVNRVNHIQDQYTKDEFYKLLIELIPRVTGNSYTQYVRPNKDEVEYEKFVAEHFEITLKQAREYINIMGADWAKQIKHTYGGKL